MKSYDVIIAGAGIIGLTAARSLSLRGVKNILILEKEGQPGLHASGRNSGVIHSGIYYNSDSNKARLCIEGNRKLKQFANENGIKTIGCGKLIVAQDADKIPILHDLEARAKKSGVLVERISETDLLKSEPRAKTHGHALFVPEVALIDPKQVLDRVISELRQSGVTIQFNQRVIAIDESESKLKTDTDSFGFGFFINAAGLFADQVAHLCQVGLEYQIMPFKGMYRKVSNPDFKLRMPIYPAPDPMFPFLGVHLTPTLDGKVTIGPSALPCFGREHYDHFNFSLRGDVFGISKNLVTMLWDRQSKIFPFAVNELQMLSKSKFSSEVAKLALGLGAKDIGGFVKVGIRAQLFDTKKGKLEMDFVGRRGKKSYHVLNAVSPAFTASFSIADMIAQEVNLS